MKTDKPEILAPTGEAAAAEIAPSSRRRHSHRDDRSRVGLFRRGRRWWISYTLHGRQYRESTGTTCKRHAQQVRDAKLAQLIQGQALPAASKSLTVSRAVAEFLRACKQKGLDSQTLRTYTHEAGQFEAFAHSRGVARLNQLHPTLLSDYIDVLSRSGYVNYDGTPRQKRSRRDGPVSQTTLNRKVIVAKMITAKAVDMELMARDPFRKVPLPPKGQEERHAFSKDEVKRIMNAFPEDLAILFRFLIYTGLRISELCWLQRVDVDLDPEAPQLFIRRKTGWKPKHGRERQVPLLTDEAIQIVKTAMASNSGPWVFSPPSSSKRRAEKDGSRRYSRGYVWEKLKAVLLKLKIPGTTHCTRHTFATHLADQGMPPLQLKEMMGHKKLETILVYYHVGKIARKARASNISFASLIPAKDAPEISTDSAQSAGVGGNA